MRGGSLRSVQRTSDIHFRFEVRMYRNYRNALTLAAALLLAAAISASAAERPRVIVGRQRYGMSAEG